MDTFRKLSNLSLTSVDEISHYQSIRLVEKLPDQIRDLSTNDILYLLEEFKYYSESFSFLEGFYLVDVFRKLTDVFQSKIPGIETDFDIVIRKFKSEIYCKFCNAYFDSQLNYCPNCGRKKHWNRNQTVDRQDLVEVPIPFPNQKLLQKGNFDREGILITNINELIYSLPEN